MDYRAIEATRILKQKREDIAGMFGIGRTKEDLSSIISAIEKGRDTVRLRYVGCGTMFSFLESILSQAGVELIETNREGIYEIIFTDDGLKLELVPEARKEEELEEERRMFYVAMTRAKDRLHIYWSKERYNKVLTASRFVGELLLDKAAIVPGAAVRHVKYGPGRVLQVRGGKVSIQFDGQPIPRTLDLEFCMTERLLTAE